MVAGVSEDDCNQYFVLGSNICGAQSHTTHISSYGNQTMKPSITKEVYNIRSDGFSRIRQIWDTF